MSQNDAGGLVVAFIGAWIGLQFPKFTVTVFCLLVAIKLAPTIKEKIRPHYESFIGSWARFELYSLSKWYHYRIRIIMALRRVGLSVIADWVFGSETKR